MKNKIFKKIISSFLVINLLFLMSCTNNNTTNSNSNTHIVVDHNGNSVEIPNVIDKVVVTDIYPFVSVLSIFTETADKIVGMAPPSMVAAKNSLLSELYPNLLNAKTDFVNGGNVNIEELLKLEPDVVFYPASSPAQGEMYSNAGIPALAISVNKWNYDAIETLNNWLKLIGDVFNLNNKVKLANEYASRVYNDVKKRVNSISAADKRKSFFLFQYSDTNIMTSGKNFFGQWWAESIGCKNVSEELEKDNSVSVNMEQIYVWDPDLIFITNFTSVYPKDLYNNTVGNYNWSEIDAIKNQQCFKMPLGMYRTYTPGIDTPITLYYLAKCAYPTLFEDIDIELEVKKYYKDVFNIDLNDEQVNKIFNPNKEAGIGFSSGK